jgi:hypothetical protein
MLSHKGEGGKEKIVIKNTTISIIVITSINNTLMEVTYSTEKI